MTALAGAAIVAGIDGSPQSLTAVETAASEAALRHRPLRIVHAFVWPPVGTVMTPGLVAPMTPGLAAPSLQAFRDRAEAYLAEAVELAGKVAPEVVTTADIVTGRPAPVLLAESRRADLLVLGDRGLGGFTGLIIGSVAVQTATHGDCPVLVVRGKQRPDGPVVVGVDGSRTSVLALEFAAEEADLRGAELVALHVWNGIDLTELNDSLPMTYDFWSGEEEENRVLAEALAGIAERHPDVRIRRHVRRGSARRLLNDQSRIAQLVVVGDRGHGGFTGLLLGSVSQHLIYHAECPIAVVRPALACAAG